MACGVGGGPLVSLVLHCMLCLSPSFRIVLSLGIKLSETMLVSSCNSRRPTHTIRRGSFGRFSWMTVAHSGFSGGDCLDPWVRSLISWRNNCLASPWTFSHVLKYCGSGLWHRIVVFSSRHLKRFCPSAKTALTPATLTKASALTRVEI